MTRISKNLKAVLCNSFVVIGLFTATPGQSQTWDLISTTNSNLRTDTIYDIRSGSGPWLTYALHPYAISRFNGRWQYFSDAATNFGKSNRGGRNNALYFDRNGSGLWIGRQRGIFFVPVAGPDSLNSPNPHAMDLTTTFFPDTTTERLPNVKAIYRDSRRVLWIGTNTHGLVRYAPQQAFQPRSQATARNWNPVRSGGELEVHQIVEDARAGYLWLGTTRGVVQINSNGDSLAAFLNNLGEITIRNLLADRDGRIWAATSKGLFVALDPALADFKPVCAPKSYQDPACFQQDFTAVTQDYSGAIWATTATQVFRYRNTNDPEPMRWQPEVFPCQKSANFPCQAEWPATVTGIYSITVDATGFVWVASYDQGLLRYNMLWETINLPEVAPEVKSNVINTLYWSPIDSSLYVGTLNRAARRDKTGRWEALPLPKGCSDFKVHAFFHDPAGFLLMSVFGCEPTRLVGYDFRQPPMPINCSNCAIITNRITENAYNAIIKLPDFALWLAGDMSHLWSTRIDSIKQSARFTRLTNPLGLSSQQFHTLLLQGDKFVWIGTATTGLARYNIADRRVDVRRQTAGKFNSPSMRSFYVDDKDTLWVGTSQGLARLAPPYDASPWVHVGETQDMVKFIFAARNGDIWFDSRDGVAHYSRAAGITTFPRPTKPGEGGPAHQEVNTGLSLVEKNHESFWFGTNAGISVFHSDIIPPETSVLRPSSSAPHFQFIEPNVVFLSTSTLFVQYDGGDNLTPNERIYFRTKLVREKDSAVIQQKPFSPDRAESLFFPESGTYRYEVEARDQSGNIDPEPATLIIDADLDAPSVVITQPALLPSLVPWVPAKLIVKGSVEDADLDLFRVEVTDSAGRPLLPAAQKQRIGPGKVLASVRDSTLAELEDISNLNERRIRIRVSAIDTLQHSRRDSVEARVDARLPVLAILQPKEAAQVSDSVEVSFKFIERNPVPKLRYFEAADSLQPTEIFLRLNKNDSLFSTKARVGSAAGKHVLTFVLSDSAGNLARQTLAVFRVPDVGISSTSKIWESSDGVVQVNVPPGQIPLTVRISPLVAAYSDSAKLDQLNPQTSVYSIESEPDFDREATLTFFFSNTPQNGDQLAIFRQGASNKWNRGGGRLSAENERSMLRVVIKQGGNYLVAMGATEIFQRGNVTCLPRLFSPGRDEPSPFTEVVFTLDQASPVSIHIFNTAGRRVKSLIQDGEVMPPGRHPVRWDGRDGDGKTLRSGIYIVVVQTGSFTETKTVVIQN